MVTQYLTQASAFIYVINTPNSGGVKEDRVCIEKLFFLATLIVIIGYNFLYLKDTRVTSKQLWARLVPG